MWFYEKVLKLKIKQIPVLYVGRAVEEAICRTFKESPSILLANAYRIHFQKYHWREMVNLQERQT